MTKSQPLASQSSQRGGPCPSLARLEFRGQRPTCQVPAPPIPGGFLVQAERPPLARSLSVCGVTSFTFMPRPQLVCAECDGCSLITSCLPLGDSHGGRDHHLALSLGHPASSEGCGTVALRKFSDKWTCKSRLKSDRACLLPLKGLVSHCQPGLVLLSSHSPSLLSRPEVFWSLALWRSENRVSERTIYCGASPGSTL